MHVIHYSLLHNKLSYERTAFSLDVQYIHTRIGYLTLVRSGELLVNDDATGRSIPTFE